MQDGMDKKLYDVDELVNTLLQRKSAKETVVPDEVTEPSAPLPVEEVPAADMIIPGDDKAYDDDDDDDDPLDAMPFVPTVTADEDLELEDGDSTPAVLPMVVVEAEESPKNGRRRLFGWLRHKTETTDEELYAEEWTDWGLKPIGHYSDKAIVKPSVSAGAVFVETEDKPIAEMPIVEPIKPQMPPEDIYSNRAPSPTEPTKGAAGVAVVQETMEPVEPVEPLTVSAPETTVKRVEPVTMVMPAIRTPEPMSIEATRVIEIQPKQVVAAQPEAILPEAASPALETPLTQLPDQMSLEELVRIEDVGETVANGTEEAEDLTTRLQRTREERAKDFVFDGEVEEENEPEEESVDEMTDEPEIEDFTGYDTADAIRLEMQYRRRTSLIGMLLTAGLELLLLALTLITVNIGQSPITAVGYLTVHVFCLILMAVLNYAAVSRGLSGLFTLRANNDTAPAVALATALCGLIIHFLNMDIALPVFAPLAGLLLVFNAAGQYIKVARIRENFAFASYVSDKYAAERIEDKKALQEIGRCVAMNETANVVYFRRTSFLASYLNNAYEEDGGDCYAKFGAPIAMGLSMVLSLALLAFGVLDGFWMWLSTLVFMLCLSSFSMLFAMQLPLKTTCRRILRHGGFLVGWNAVDAFGQPNALVIDVADLYPDESMLLHGIKTFSGMHIDAAILDAASLSIRAGGPLSLVFRRIIQNKEELLREVDSLAYEQGMGLSGWVDGRRVLVGNRRLLQNHDVDVPSTDYEMRYAKNGRRLVYLSTSGVLSAMFVVSYLPDESIAVSLQDLCRSHVNLLVRSNDPNITAETLCADFDLDEYYVEVLPAVAGRMYDKLIAEEVQQAPALMASNGHILGTAMVLAACRSLRIKQFMILAWQVLTAFAGLVVCIPWALSAIGSYILPAIGFMLAATLLSWLLPLLKR